MADLNCNCGTFCDGNVITNPFFNNQLTGWTATGKYYSGNYFAALIASASATSSISQNVLITGSSYDISFDYRFSLGGVCTGSLYVLAGSSSYGPIQPTYNQASLSTTLTCISSSTFSIEYRITNPIQAGCSGSSPCCTIPLIIDNVCVKESAL